MSQDCVMILSSDNDVQVIENSDVKFRCSHDEATIEKRRIPLQSVVTGKGIFNEFLNKCKLADNSSDMQLVIKKMRKRFDRAAEEFTSSKVFVDLVEKALQNLPSGPYCQLKIVSDELNHNKRIRTNASSKASASDSAETFVDSSEVEIDPITLSHVRKLEKTLKILHKRIQRLESDEVDFNSSDEENSAYIQVTRYKERICQVYRKLCELQHKDPHAERHLKKRIKFSGTKIKAVDKAIEKFYNDRREFPDYRDILTVVQKANEVKKLNLRPYEIEHIARDAFQEFGKILKKWRLYDDHEIFSLYFTNEEDPASQDLDLRNKLEENEKKYKHRIDEVIDKYALKQIEEKLEPEIVVSDDGSAEEDDDDDDDDEVEDDEAAASEAEGVQKNYPDSDCRSRNSYMECKSDGEDDDIIQVPDCRVVLTDVRYSPEWEYFLRQTCPDNCDTRNIPSVSSEKDDCSRLDRKRQYFEDRNESAGSLKKRKLVCDDCDPIPSTSKQSIPIKCANYWHISEEELNTSLRVKRKNSNCDISQSKDECVNADDCDVIEIVSDSCEKLTENTEENSNNNEKRSQKKSTSSENVKCVKNVDAQHRDVSPMDIVSVEMSVDEFTEKSEAKTAKNSSADIISVDICNDDSECSTKIVDVLQENCNLNKIESDHDKNRNNLTGRKTETKSNDCSKDVGVNNDTDEIMIIDEVPNEKKPDEVVNIENTTDKLSSKSKIFKQLALPSVNLTQMIRGMEFGKNLNLLNAQKNKLSGSFRNQTNSQRLNNEVKTNHTSREVVSINPGTSGQKVLHRSNTSYSVGQNNFTNKPSRSENNVMGNDHAYGGHFLAPIRNFPHTANARAPMQFGQAAMQKRHYTTHTIQQHKYDQKTNSVVTRKQITTVVEESVMRINNSQLPSNFNVIGQRRLVNRRVQHIQRSGRSVNLNSAEDVITLD